MTLGEKIKETRETLMLTQSALAARTGISRVSIGNYERGNRIPNSNVLKKIANALHTTPDYLLGSDPFFNNDEKTDNFYNKYMPNLEFDFELEEFLEKHGYIITPSIFDYDDEQDRQTKIVEWTNPEKQYYNIIHDGIEIKVSPHVIVEFEKNIMRAIEFEWFKIKQNHLK